MIELTRVTSRRRASFRQPTTGPRIVSVGTATPPCRYTQLEVLEKFQESDRKIRRLYSNSHINSRYLYLPDPVDGKMPEESNQELLDKHLNGALEIGSQAIDECLSPVGLTAGDVDFLCCVTSTGFLCPGLSAYLVKHLGFRDNVQRLDVLGMGCSAAQNGLQATTAFSRANPGRPALMVCVEICSAAYVYDGRLSTAVVNSLFGDGAAAVLVRDTDEDRWDRGPILMDFESHIITEAIGAMRYELAGSKLSFYLDRAIPYVIGLNVEKPVKRLLGRHRLKPRDIQHWLIHSGGKKVVNAIEYNLGLSDHDVRHTLNVLRNYGNLSSGSILFSYKELCREGVIAKGDLGVAIAMGPGTAIETALLSW